MKFFSKFIEAAKFYSESERLSIVTFVCLLLTDFSFQLYMTYRINHKIHKLCNAKPILWVIPKIIQYFIKVYFGSFIAPDAKIGKNFKIIYGMGIVIGSKVAIGDNGTIFNGVSLGSAMPGQVIIKQPKIGNNVLIGTGAKVLGDINIGDNVKIGANSVVLHSFGPNVTIAGVPARIVNKDTKADLSGSQLFDKKK